MTQIRVIFLFTLLSSISFNSYFVVSSEASSFDLFAGNMIGGKTLEEWAKEYWQWWMTVPETIPKDPTTNLDSCVIGSDPSGLMIFLVNAYQITYNAKCAIPSDKYILVPLLIGECDATVPDPRGKSENIQDKWACAKDANEIFKSWEVVLDGTVIYKNSGNEVVNQNITEQILVRNSSVFTLNIPEINRYSAPAGSYPAVVDGYYLGLKPLSTGEHVLEYSIVHEIPVPGVGMPQQIPGKASYSFTVQ
jgi:hypothetical protein